MKMALGAEFSSAELLFDLLDFGPDNFGGADVGQP
jgi:hypothetical protein